MSENDKKLCSNCDQYIESSKFFLHERMCSLNVKRCPKCNTPFTIEDLEVHIDEKHGEGECEFCKKKFPKIDLEKHKKKCDCKMVPCSYCELEVLLGELKEHQKSCGAITEPCPLCGQYIQKKEMDNHLLQGCPPPKNDRRSVEVVHNTNSKLSLNTNKNDTYIYNNYNPINDFNLGEILYGFDRGKTQIIKMHDNHNKPNFQIRPASGKKSLNENFKKNSSILGKNDNKNSSNLNIINNKNKQDNENLIKKTITNNLKSSLTQKTSINNSNYYNSYMNKQNISKEAVPLKASNNINFPNNNIRNIEKKNSFKPVFATNLSKGNLNKNIKTSKDQKTSDEEFRKSRDKFTFQNAKNLEKSQLNKQVNNLPNQNVNKRLITDEDFMANFNFGEVDDDQLMQQVIEQSLKEQMKK